MFILIWLLLPSAVFIVSNIECTFGFGFRLRGGCDGSASRKHGETGATGKSSGNQPGGSS